MVERQLPKLHTGVRFPSPARFIGKSLRNELWVITYKVITLQGFPATFSVVRRSRIDRCEIVFGHETPRGMKKKLLFCVQTSATEM